jgi:hypothetical protein
MIHADIPETPVRESFALPLLIIVDKRCESLWDVAEVGPVSFISAINSFHFRLYTNCNIYDW